MQQRFHSVKENARRSATIGAAFITPSRAIKGGRGKGEFCKEACSSLLPSLFPVVAAFAIFVSYPRAIYKCQAFACTCSTLYDLCIPIVRERERQALCERRSRMSPRAKFTTVASCRSKGNYEKFNSLHPSPRNNDSRGEMYRS